MATSSVQCDAVPSALRFDAVPLLLNEATIQPEHQLNPFLNTLKTEDYISILFMFIDKKLKREEFLKLIQKEKDALKNAFINLYDKFHFKDALLIEIFGTMQRFDLVKLLGACGHTFTKDKETFTQLSSVWKFLYTLCDQLQNSEVEYLKEKLFPERVDLNVCCAEELICLAFFRGKLVEDSWKTKLEDIFKSLNPNLSNLIASYKGSNLNYYPLRRPSKKAPCGLAVIMNHVKFDIPAYPDRPESDSDANALKKLWEEFGFKTQIYQDLNGKEVLDVFTTLSKEDHSKYDAFIACYLSHGDEGVVIARDGASLKLMDLVDTIANKCETLVGKPKMFFVQACQGRGIQTGFGGPTVISGTPTETQIPAARNNNIPLRLDVFMSIASIEGYVSFRDGTSSWFINGLVSEMEKSGEELTVSSVLTKVEDRIAENRGSLKKDDKIVLCKQTPVRYTTLRYELKLKKSL